MNGDSSERRRHPRVPMSQPCWCESDEVTLYVKIVNASEGGVFLRTATPLEVGSRARLVFFSPDLGDEVVADVEVVRCVEEQPGRRRLPGMGLRFLSFEKNGDRFLDVVRSTPPFGVPVS